MNAIYSRVSDRLWSAVCKLMMLVIAICAPLHAAQAQTDIAIAGGNNQSGYTNDELASPLTVSFSGSSYVLLDFHVTSGNAFFEESGNNDYVPNGGTFGVNAGDTTSAHLILPSNAGPVTVTATCQSGCTTVETLTFNETATPPPPYLEMDITAGNNQSGPVNSTLPTPLTVSLTPTPLGYDGPFTEQITFTVESGSATFAPNHSTTYTTTVSLGGGQPGKPGSKGAANRSARALAAARSFRASVPLILGSTPGPIEIRVTCPDCTVGGARVFRETATPSTTSTLQKISGDQQTGLVGSQATAPLVVQLPGSSGQTITWSVTSGQASLSANTTVTDSSGNSSITFRYGNAAGPISISATAGTAGTVIFTETATTGGSATVVSGNNQTGTAGGTLQPFVVQFGSGTQGASGLLVTWTVVQGVGTLSSPTTTTDSNGRTSNTLVLGPNPGVVIVQASASGFGSTTFTSTAIAGIPGGSLFTIVSGNNQALVPNVESQPLVVKLASANGQGIAGAAIQWTVSGSSGALDSATTTTDASGQSSNAVKIILPAAYTVTAQVANHPEIPPVTFTFNNAVANLPQLSAPQIGVAHAIDKACPALAGMSNLNPQQQDFLARCSEVVVGSGTDPSQVPGALNAMLNNKTTPQTGLADSVIQGQLNNLNIRLAELRQGSSGLSVGGLTFNEDGRTLPVASLGDVFTSYRKDPKEGTDEEVGKDFARWGFFATGMIDRGGASADGISPGFDFSSSSLTAGVDYRFNDAFVGGLALGYASNKSDLDLNAGKVDIDSYSLNAYFTWYNNSNFYVEGSVVADWLNYDLSRNIAYQIASLDGGTTNVNQTASASPDGKQYSLSLSFGRDFNRGAWGFSPYVRGVYTHVSLDGFSESLSDPSAPGAGLGTEVDSRSFTSELGVLGGRVTRTISMDWGVLVPNALVEWNHEFKNDPQTVVTRFLADPTQTPIFITDSRIDQNYFNLGIGLNAILPQGRSGFLYYEHVAGLGGIHENRLSLGVRIEF
ncbi:MAG TPA: autotransporter domain-containing protein [Rudaea sp.]|jgi:outer membrane autotransporter protein|nr:autotransporter domain-containing protein [Rudaea sp.]